MGRSIRMRTSVYHPCKYRNVGIAENGRAFERKDGLFDIYNADGVLVNEGSTYY